MSISGGKFKALLRGKEVGCESIQVFIRNVRGWASKPFEQKDINEFIEKKKLSDEEIEELQRILNKKGRAR